MSSETVTRNDLMSILNKALPSDHYVEGWEYVGLVNQIHWSSWTCPEDGMVVADIGLMTNGGVWYYYVNDTTDNFAVGKISGTNANGTSRTISFPVIKGHTYQQSAFQSVDGSALYFRYYKFTLKDPITTSPVDSVIARTISANINKAYGYYVTMTAPTISGYKFLCWAEVATNGWVGSVYPSTPLSQTSTMWNATTGQTGTGQIDCVALYIPMRNSDADGVVSLTTVKETYTQTLSTSTWYGTTTFDITKDGYTPISAVASVNQVRYHCQVSDFTDTSVTVNVADYSSTGMNVTVKLIVTYAMN